LYLPVSSLAWDYATIAAMPAYAYAILVVGWLIWLTPFFRAKRTEKPAKQVDRRARWGILLVGIAYSLLLQGRFWERSPKPWQVALSIVLFALASLLSWTGARALGRQWRIDAGLSADHELVMSGPYRLVRHPIYTSLLCILLGTGFLITPWRLLLPAILLFVIGTEIRVRIEDNLLASQFGDRFSEYKKRVPAYIPFPK
jgi:protein-S-isoprenylcysteine O-methyltransferase Ste14